MAGRKGCLRRGCGCLVLLLAIAAVLAVVGYLRGSAEPETYQEQRELLEQRSPDERRDLAEQTRQRLRGLLRQPSSTAAPRDSLAIALPSVSAAPEPPAPPPSLNEPPPSSGRRPDATNEPARPRQREKPVEDDREEEKQEARRITLRLDELNALLEQEAGRWMAQEGGELPLSNPILAIEEDHLVLFVQLSTPGSTLLLGLPFQATVDETGGVVHLLGVRLGQLPLPGLEALPHMLRAAKDPRLDRLAEKADAAAAGYPIEPRLDLGDGRALWVLDAEIDPEEQAVHLLVQED